MARTPGSGRGVPDRVGHAGRRRPSRVGVCNTGRVTTRDPDISRQPGPAGAAGPDGAAAGDPALGTAGAAGASGTAGAAGPDGAAAGAAGASGTAGDPAPGTASRSWWRAILLLSIALAVLAVDVVTKVLVVASIAPGENVRILGGLVYLTQIRNAGAAFNMATGMTWLLAIIALAVVAFIVRMAPRLRSTPWAVCLGLVLGGALGNLTDRVFRAPGILRGHVVDFVSVFGPNAQYFPAFNTADSAISIGGVMLVLVALLGYDFDGQRRQRRRRSGG